MTDASVSIILRSFNEAWALRDTLPALRAQNYRDWELIVIDSGSTDGSVELIRAAQPAQFVRIASEEYNPSRVMNRGMQLARHDLAIFLNADATPIDEHWLRPLVDALRSPRTAAAFSRQVPRPDCRAVFAHDYERCFGPQRESAQWDHFFSMVGSGIRRDVWEQRGFLEEMQYSEDEEYTRWCRAAGYGVVYCPDSVVMHSHNYTPRQAFKRAFGEAWACMAMRSGRAADGARLRGFALGWLRDVQRDFAYCARERRLRECPHAARIRWAQRAGRLAGTRAGRAVHEEDFFHEHRNRRPEHRVVSALQHPA
ncbi:MAG: glycosyltransferase [Opitutae bacterium]|nr:glycosyltransferase [Opitutae bacterium]